MALDGLLRSKLRKYKNAELCRQDCARALHQYNNLTPDLQKFVHNDGRESELLALDGTLPVSIRGVTYNIPVCVWLQENHPHVPPLVFVKPTSSMAIKPSHHVDTNGKVYLPFLHEWSYPKSDLAALLQVLCCIFSESPPVYSKLAQPQPQAAHQPTSTGVSLRRTHKNERRNQKKEQQSRENERQSHENEQRSHDNDRRSLEYERGSGKNERRSSEMALDVKLPKVSTTTVNLDAPLRSRLAKYKHAELCRQDCARALHRYNNLSPDLQKFIHNDGRETELLALDGTLPVVIRGVAYNIPVCIWLQESHPKVAPLVFVKPTSSMAIKPSHHVDTNGKVYLPFLHEWSYPKSDLASLLQILSCVFAEHPPVYSKAA
ncbi:unnamed protein product [Porites lobata]|uniref:UEV domain-containing protein n=1 Tax=Porites lobata TaxID=104759 RepID=A0ABN8QM35_9CNID|nr:unnamed protein product [Porites lobata]